MPPELARLRSRRKALLGTIGWPCAALPLTAGWLPQIAGAQSEEPREALNRFPRMVHEFFVSHVRDIERRSLAVKSSLRTKADAERYVNLVRQKIRRCFGPEPERTPLNARTTRTIERDGYNIENVIFESRPGFPVTANLYLPTNRSGRLPGVVGTCGHSNNGKAAGAYQSFAQGLARQGYICLIYDPIGQGERLQYVDAELRPRRGVGVSEHIYAGNQQFLVGEFLGMWRAWDGIRALDYLLSRNEVDSEHVGVTGNSGGGTMTTWLCGVEHRWTMAAPSCFVTTFRRNLENELPADTEQCPPRALAEGLDHDDFLAALAPRPTIILCKERDYFDVRGSEEAFGRLQRLYNLLEAPEQIGMFVGPTYHGYSQENREAMYGWFHRATGSTEDSGEPNITIEPDEVLWCTPNGQVAELEGTRSVHHYTAQKAKQLQGQRRPLAGRQLHAAIRQVLKLPAPSPAAPDYRIWRYLGSRGYPSQHGIAYAVESEPGIQAIVYRLADEQLHSRPPRGATRAVLYVSHRSSDVELREEPFLRQIAASAGPDTPVFTVDVRGIGESLPDTCRPNSFDSPYGSDYFYAIHSLMLDRPYVGQRTWDVLRVLQWLDSLGHRDVHLTATGWGTLPATFAAVLSPTVKQVSLKGALPSYQEIAEAEEYDLPLSMLPPNILARFDLPDCYRELAGKALKIEG